MGRIILLLLLISGSLHAQPPGYTKINARYQWLAGAFGDGLHVPQYNGVPTDRTGVWMADGAVAQDTLNGHFYYRQNGTWVRVAKYSDIGTTPTWQQTLTAGSVLTGTNTILGSDGSLIFEEFADITLNAPSAAMGNTNKSIIALSDSISVKPYQGKLNIDTLRTATDTTLSKPMTWDPATGRWQYLPYWPVSSGTSTRFGKSGEDATATENRAFDADGFDFTISNIAEGAIGASGDLAVVSADTLTLEGAAVIINGPVTARWKARVGSTTSSATPTINTDNVDIYKLTAQAADITSMTTNLSGTPNDGDILEIQITGTASRAITWGASFVDGMVARPTTTTSTTTLVSIWQWFTSGSFGTGVWACMSHNE